MSQAGAQAERRRQVEREFAQHACEVAKQVAAQFQPIYERICRERDVALERAAVLQTCVELVALGLPGFDGSNAEYAQQILDQLGIVPDVQTEADGTSPETGEAEA